MAKKKSTVSLLAIIKFRCWLKPINSWKTFSFSVCILIKFNMNQKVNLRKFFIAQNITGLTVSITVCHVYQNYFYRVSMKGVAVNVCRSIFQI